MSDIDRPSAIEFWDYCSALHEMADQHWTQVRTIETKHDFVLDSYDEEKAEREFNDSVASLMRDFDLLDQFGDFPMFCEQWAMHEAAKDMAKLLRRTIIFRSLNDGSFGKHSDNWSNLSWKLHSSINDCAQYHPEVSEIIFQRALSGIKTTKPKPRDEIQAGALPRLSKNKKIALQIIKDEGPITGKLIAERIGIEESTFYTHYIKDLKLHGVRNDEDGQGYYWLETPDQSIEEQGQ